MATTGYSAWTPLLNVHIFRTRGCGVELLRAYYNRDAHTCICSFSFHCWSFNLITLYYFCFTYDLGQKYYAPQVRPDQGSNSWTPDHDSTFHVTETPALTTRGPVVPQRAKQHFRQTSTVYLLLFLHTVTHYSHDGHYWHRYTVTRTGRITQPSLLP